MWLYGLRFSFRSFVFFTCRCWLRTESWWTRCSTSHPWRWKRCKKTVRISTGRRWGPWCWRTASRPAPRTGRPAPETRSGSWKAGAASSRSTPRWPPACSRRWWTGWAWWAPRRSEPSPRGRSSGSAPRSASRSSPWPAADWRSTEKWPLPPPLPQLLRRPAQFSAAEAPELQRSSCWWKCQALRRRLCPRSWTRTSCCQRRKFR